MIFAIAGTQLPFPRLMSTLNRIAERHGLETVAQTAEPAFLGTAMRCEAWMAAGEFERMLAAASIIVAHAGIGTIIGAAQHRKPLVLMPRRAALHEHRNDHQIATAERFRHTPGVTVVNDEAELEAALLAPSPEPVAVAAGERRQALIAAVAQAISGR